MARKPPKGRPVLPSEKSLWDHVTVDVRPINIEKPTIVAPIEQPRAQSKTKPTGKRREVHVDPDPAPSRPTLPDLSHGIATGMDRRTAQRLKRGKLTIDGRLDLHGHTQTRAHEALSRFVQRAYETGQRTVLVITGKGGRGLDEPGVLRTAVPKWLNEMPMRQYVSGFSYASPQDGGHGALYVRVKRRR